MSSELGRWELLNQPSSSREDASGARWHAHLLSSVNRAPPPNTKSAGRRTPGVQAKQLGWPFSAGESRRRPIRPAVMVGDAVRSARRRLRDDERAGGARVAWLETVSDEGVTFRRLQTLSTCQS
jgi:hypothetical protein